MEARRVTNSMGGDRPRNADDAYFTPDALALAIAGRLAETIGRVKFVIEPSAGDGAFVRAAAATWPGAWIAAVEPNAGPDIEGADETQRTTWEASLARPGDGPTLILGNPPFLLAEEHATLALDRLGHRAEEPPEPGTRHVAFLLRASFLAGGERTRRLHLGMGGLRYVWHVTPRPSFTLDGKTDGAEYAVLVWEAGWRGGYEGGWLEWAKAKRADAKRRTA